MPTEFDAIALDAAAVHASLGLVACAEPADLSRPTPCADWTLHGLITHMTAQHYGFAAAAAGDSDPARWWPRRLGRDHVAEYRAATRAVLAAFAAPGVLDRQFPLPEFAGSPSFRGRQAVSFHFVDYVAHSWDVARSLGRDLRLAPEVLEAALAVARAVPQGEGCRGPRSRPRSARRTARRWTKSSPSSDATPAGRRSTARRQPHANPAPASGGRP